MNTRASEMELSSTPPKLLAMCGTIIALGLTPIFVCTSPQIAQAQTPSVTLTTSSPSVAAGSSVTFTATVTAGITGNITFYDGSTTIGTEPISGSAATLPTNSLAVGYHNITAYWPGNSTYGPITSSIVVQTIYQPGPMQIPPAGVIATIAGNGIKSYAGDNGYAMAAELNLPDGVATDSSGNVYIADYKNNRVRKVNASTGLITTVAGNGTGGYSGDGGLATNAALYQPIGIALDSSGNLYIADSENERIRKVTASTGKITTVAGNGTIGYSGDGGQATAASLSFPSDVAVDALGNLYITDSSNNRIRKVTTSTGIITTVAGNGTWGYSGDGGPAISAELGGDWAATVDANGNIYIAESGNTRVRKVTASTGIITTIAGNGTLGFSGDGGQAVNAELNEPIDVETDAGGNIFIDDWANQRIRRVDVSTGIITTVAGNGSLGYSGDGGPATGAELHYPQGIALDSSGNLYIADNYNNRIRVVGSMINVTIPPAPTGLTATAGDGQVALSWDWVSEATSYNVYEGTSPAGESSTPIATGISGNAYTVASLTNGTAYYFTVAAVNSGGTSGYSNEATATPDGPVVTAVTPSSGNTGLAVTLSGYGFGAAQGQSTVSFNGVVAGALSWSDSSITAVVPSTAATGPVIVTVVGIGPSNNNVIFTVSTSTCN